MSIQSFSRPLLIVNPVSGSGKAMKQYDEDKQSLFLLYPNLASYITQCPGDFVGIQHMIQKHNPNLLIVYGGDGTLNDVVNGSDAKIPIAIIPVGSGNDFATLLGIDNKSPISSRLTSPKTMVIDLGNCNGHWFVNGLGVGFDGEIARQTVANTASIPSIMKYYLAIFRSIFFYSESDYTISWGEDPSHITKVQQSALMISVANGQRYGGSFRVAPLSSPTDGLLDLIVIGKVHPLLRLVYLPLIVLGKHLGLSFVWHQCAKYVHIGSNKVAPAHMDGELTLAESFEVTIHPEKLKFIL